jgi:hypothetical protein
LADTITLAVGCAILFLLADMIMDLPKRNPIIHLLYILCVLSMLPFLIWIHWQTSALAATSEQIHAVQLSKLDQKSKLNQTHTSQTQIKQPKMISGVSAVIALENSEQQIEKLWANFGYAKLIDLLAKNNNRVYVVYTDFNAQKRTVNLTLGFTGKARMNLGYIK